ncbi:S9 family peptidase [Streptomyces europaeiscabiei]|uniref:S9 family peptidase n=1 Tax=Streptomyces europaeiscabiei TaxID=146819 RepID=UPI002E12DCED|nr:S9 family peptidase [Streptomyces europaeiscabiei]
MHSVTTPSPQDGAAPAAALGLADLTRFRIPEQVALSPLGDTVAVIVRKADPERDRWLTFLALADSTGGDGVLQVLDEDHADAPCWSPAGDRLAYLAKAPGGNGTSIRVWSAARRASTELVRDLTAVSHLTWSPDGSELVFVAAVELDGGEPTGTRRTDPPTVVRELGYKMDGIGLLPAARRRLCVVRADTGEVRCLTDDKIDVSAPSWSPEGRTIVFGGSEGRGAAAWTHLYSIDASGGAARQISTWGGILVWTGWSPEGHVVFAGQDTLGPCRRSLYQLAEGTTEPLDLLARFDRRLMASNRGTTPAAVFLANGEILFCAREAGCTWAYTVSPVSGAVTPWLTGESTVIQAMSAAETIGTIALVLSDAQSVGEIHVSNLRKAEPRRVTDLNPWSAHARITTPEDIRFHTPGRTEVHGYLLRGRPVEAEGPTLLDIHGGPDNAWRPSFSPYYLYRQVLVERGWNILLLNPRGSDGYGEAYMREPTGRLGFSEEEDFILALDALVRDGLATEGQVAVMGSSHGGFMTNWLTARTDRFAAGVSTAGVANWTSLYGTSWLGAVCVPIMLGGTPDEVPERYSASSPLTYATGATTPTLLVHGEQDLMTPIGQSEEWFTTLRREKRDVEFVRYPSAGHLFMYNGAISHQLDYGRRIVEWLTQHVEGDDRQ